MGVQCSAGAVKTVDVSNYLLGDLGVCAIADALVMDDQAPHTRTHVRMHTYRRKHAYTLYLRVHA